MSREEATRRYWRACRIIASGGAVAFTNQARADLFATARENPDTSLAKSAIAAIKRFTGDGRSRPGAA